MMSVLIITIIGQYPLTGSGRYSKIKGECLNKAIIYVRIEGTGGRQDTNKQVRLTRREMCSVREYEKDF